MSTPDDQPWTNLTTSDWIGFIGMIVGMFMAVLDIQIINSSLKQIQAGLSATQDEIAWVQTAYLIAEVLMIPLCGWLSRVMSTRYLYFICCIGFTVMSAACAFSWDLNSMIVFRALQGFFGGALIPTVFAVIFTRFPAHMRTNLTILVGSVVTLAPTLGPVLGGYLTEQVSWQAMFLINIIPGVLICVTTWLYVHVDSPDWGLFRHIDIKGIIYIVLFLGSLQFVIEEGVRHEWFESREIVFFTILSITGGILLFHRELTCEHPIIDLRAFKNINFCIGSIFSFVIGWGLYTALYLQPLYLGIVKNLSSLQIGAYIMVTGFFQFFSAPLAAGLTKIMDQRFVLALGLTMFGAGTWLNSYMSYDWGYAEFFMPQAVRGLSLMLCFLPVNSLALGTLPPHQVKNASGLYNLMRNLGGAIGLAVTNTLFLHGTKAHYAQLRESVTAASQSFQDAMLGLSARLEAVSNSNVEASAIKLITAFAQREATIMTISFLFKVISLLFFGSAILIVFVKKVQVQKAPEGH